MSYFFFFIHVQVCGMAWRMHGSCVVRKECNGDKGMIMIMWTFTAGQLRRGPLAGAVSKAMFSAKRYHT